MEGRGGGGERGGVAGKVPIETKVLVSKILVDLIDLNNYKGN